MGKRGVNPYALAWDLDRLAKIAAPAVREHERRVRRAKMRALVAAQKARRRYAREREAARVDACQARGKGISVDHDRGQHARRGIGAWRTVLARMVVGQWYRSADLERLVPEFAGRTVRARLADRLMRDRLVTRRPDPGFDQGRHWGVQDGRWLYALTDAGASEARLWAGL